VGVGVAVGIGVEVGLGVGVGTGQIQLDWREQAEFRQRFVGQVQRPVQYPVWHSLFLAQTA